MKNLLDFPYAEALQRLFAAMQEDDGVWEILEELESISARTPISAAEKSLAGKLFWMLDSWKRRRED